MVCVHNERNLIETTKTKMSGKIVQSFCLTFAPPTSYYDVSCSQGWELLSPLIFCPYNFLFSATSLALNHCQYEQYLFIRSLCERQKTYKNLFIEHQVTKKKSMQSLLKSNRVCLRFQPKNRQNYRERDTQFYMAYTSCRCVKVKIQLEAHQHNY